MSKPLFVDPPSGVRAYRMGTARGEFAVHDLGEAAHGTALLLPGFTGSKEDFLALLEPLATSGYRVVAVDGRGQHETGGPRDESAYARAELVRDVLALAYTLFEPAEAAPPGHTAEAAELREPADPDGGGRSTARGVHLVGHSLGGLIARDAVLTDARPFASLTLTSSGPAAVSTVQRERIELLLSALPVLDMGAIWQAMQTLDPVTAAAAEAAPAQAPQVTESVSVRDFLRRRWLANVPEQLSATGQQLLSEPDRVAELAEVRLPFLVLSGETDVTWPVADMDGMAARLGARRGTVAGAGHSPNAERPEATCEVLLDFWAAVATEASGTGPVSPRRAR